MNLTVSDRDRLQYDEQGFVVFANVLSDDELSRLRRDFDASIAAFRQSQQDAGDQQREYARVFTQQINMWQASEDMRTWVLHPMLGAAAQTLCGARRVRLFHDHGLEKPAHDGQPTSWHQDKMYWPMAESRALTCWIALDDVDERNGCLRFAPGSHHGDVDQPIDFLKDDARLRSADSPLGGPAPFDNRLSAGGISFHHCLTYHYAHANRTDRPRRAWAIIYMPDGTTYTGGKHYCTDGRGLKVGAPIAGDEFPLAGV